MVKRRKISDFLESSPQFCKVYIPNKSSHRLEIPPDFVKHFYGNLPYKSKITTLEERSWHVELKEVDEHLYFQEGWQQIVHDNSLEYGDFLVFYYGGNAQFYTKIYGKNGCPKKVSRSTREIDTEIKHSQDNQTVEQRKSKRLVQGGNDKENAQKQLYPRFSCVIQEANRACQEASKFISEFPSFKVVMHHSYVNKGFMGIPSSFHRYIKDRRGATLIASDRSWPVKLTKHHTIRQISQGWSVFSRENTLKVGDVCVFELIEKNDVLLKVTIFRCPD